MFTLNCKGRLLLLNRPLVMGILNVTPDSFYSGSRFQEEDRLLQQAEQMLQEGADILDLGAQSTRPGSERIGIGEELQRLEGPVSELHRRFPDAVISIDTYYAEVARRIVAAGASMVNDISGGSFDPAMIPLVGTLGVPYICMHVKGTPDTMHRHQPYTDIGREVLDYFIAKTADCKAAGIHDVIIDPGFGFSKTPADNLTLLHQLPGLQMLNKPVLVGLSRKSTVYKTLGITAAEALNGTTVLNTIALLHGANILRVHDVKEAVEAVRLVEAFRNAKKAPAA